MIASARKNGRQSRGSGSGSASWPPPTSTEEEVRAKILTASKILRKSLPRTDRRESYASQILGHKLLEEEAGDADHRQAAHVHLGVVQGLDVRTLALAEAERVEAEVAGHAVLLVLDAEEVAVVLVALKVVLGQ